MWTKPQNPTVIKLITECRERRMNLSPIVAAVSAEGAKLCAWCLAPLTGRRYKWCSKACGDSAFAWANPQSEYGLAHLLHRQDYSCAGCAHNWHPLANSLMGTRGIAKAHNVAQFSMRFMKSLKRQSPKGTKPEVDHVIPVALGGATLGFDNHQAICTQCHKAKTKIQNSGPRTKKARCPNQTAKTKLNCCFCSACCPDGVKLPGKA